jgi:hypothetical protein
MSANFFSGWQRGLISPSLDAVIGQWAENYSNSFLFPVAFIPPDSHNILWRKMHEKNE